ncbi:sigma-54-dependent transcriptional regulator [Phycisphaerales bacterium AB-hyl4]|uniref:Sigma-54-dependent transcriptional regulator n=1 Tax=Natronomicrosphaera hydrolytica TaxID=3242702 RepID=A0ABV4U3G0_9BACT
MHKAKVFIVDDEPGMLEVCADTLAKLDDVEVAVESNGNQAVKRLTGEESWDLLITDIRMPDIHGVDLLRIARRHDPNLVVLMLTAFPTVETAVESMKLGAADYLTKPFLPDDLRATVRRLLEQRRLREENNLLQRQVERSNRFGDMIGCSEPMRRVFDTVQRVAPNDVDVLILGETGTGKELVARSIHQQSGRKDNRFVPVDCGAIPEALLESEFFGHERGAFSGADTRSLGLMEFADGGTFFLDEIGQLPINLQAKLLRALQERRIRRVGGTQEIELDVRVIAATSLNLEQEIAEQRFRADLFYRINVARIDLPPLRDRAEDIALLARHFVQRHAGEMGHKQINITPEALEVLCSYRWPGNVRELQNAIRRALAMTRDSELRPDDLPTELVIAAGDVGCGKDHGLFELRDQHVTDFERQYLAQLMQRHQGDVVAAVGEAKVPRGTLYRLLKKHDLNPADFRFDDAGQQI